MLHIVHFLKKKQQLFHPFLTFASVLRPQIHVVDKNLTRYVLDKEIHKNNPLSMT